MRVRSPDWSLVFRRLEAWAAEVSSSDPKVLGVLLYGSLARGDHAPGSDADLLVVVEESPFPPPQRSRHLPSPRLPICYEILVYTEEELRRFLEGGNLFLRRALREGRWLARRATPPWQGLAAG